MKHYVTIAFTLVLWLLVSGVGASVCDDSEGATAAQGYDVRIEEHLDTTDLDYEIDAEGDFLLAFSYQDGRSQLVIVNSGTEHFLGMETREIWAFGHMSTSKQLDESIVRYLLNANGEVKLGAWQVQYIDEAAVVSFRAIIAADAGVETLMATLLMVGIVADNMEADLTGADDL